MSKKKCDYTVTLDDVCICNDSQSDILMLPVNLPDMQRGHHTQHGGGVLSTVLRVFIKDNRIVAEDSKVRFLPRSNEPTQDRLLDQIVNFFRNKIVKKIQAQDEETNTNEVYLVDTFNRLDAYEIGLAIENVAGSDINNRAFVYKVVLGCIFVAYLEEYAKTFPNTRKVPARITAHNENGNSTVEIHPTANMDLESLIQSYLANINTYINSPVESSNSNFEKVTELLFNDMNDVGTKLGSNKKQLYLDLKGQLKRLLWSGVGKVGGKKKRTTIDQEEDYY